ncbi:TetR family transcriptional regulator [Gordonia amarae]|uniref:TetR/AcrR family transcriptional regulator C-terminal domain-containing protein n=1 Tax=Gordonia amarae TaxID=36821 RepID=UPI001AF11163|nr:TetR/AcrR family transcriptional regulator C-terminal domain-containing protein [Gordonia amarae]QHN31792.1 TetR family transcriptional regulator [Gordonia amarae]
MPNTQRAVRSGGKQTRLTLLRAADEVFLEHGERASVAQICERAQTFPNQVTYYFGSKEQLFVEVACAAVLRAGRHAEEAADDAGTLGAYAGTLVRTLLGPELARVQLFTTAMLLASRRTDLREHTGDTLRLLHERGEVALHRTLARIGWQPRTPVEVEAKAFWSAVFGVAVQMSATTPDIGYSLTDSVAVVFAHLAIPDNLLDFPLTPEPAPRPIQKHLSEKGSR